MPFGSMSTASRSKYFAYRPGEVTLTIGRKTIAAETFFKVMGAMPTATTV